MYTVACVDKEDYTNMGVADMGVADMGEGGSW